MSNSVVSRLGEFVSPTGEETRLDIAYPDHAPRITIRTRTALIAAAALAVVVGLLLSYAFLQSASAPVAPSSAAPQQVAEVSGAGGGEGDIVVSVVGPVAVQGLVTLAPGSRVADALTAAGGLLEGADPAALNQAQLLVDGQQIVVPAVGAPPPAQAGAGAAAGAGGMVSLNSADAAGLTSLDGVGEVTAQAIVEYREQIGGFSSVEQLLDVSGIGPAKYEAIKDHVTL